MLLTDSKKKYNQLIFYYEILPYTICFVILHVFGTLWYRMVFLG